MKSDVKRSENTIYYEKGLLRVKYHTTFKDIAISILVVLACALICLYGLVSINLVNPAQPFADFLLAKLDGGSDYTFRSERIERSFLKTLDFGEVSLERDDETLVQADSISINQGLQTFLLSLKGGSRSFVATIENPKVLLFSEAFALSQSDDSSEFLTSWLHRNTFSLQANSLDGTFTDEEFTASLSDATVRLELGTALRFSDFSADIEKAEMQIGDIHFQFLDISLGLDDSLLFSTTAQEGNVSQADTSIDYHNLAVISSLPSLDVKNQKIDLALSLSDINFEYDEMQASIPHFSSTIKFNTMNLSQIEASFDLLDFSYDTIHLSLPTSTISAINQENSLLLGFATKASEPITVHMSGYEQLLLNSLAGSAQIMQSGEIYTQFTLGEASTSIAGNSILLENLRITSDGNLTKKGLETLSLSLVSNAQVNFHGADIALSSPLEAGFGFTNYLDTITSSLDLTSIESGLTTEPIRTTLAYQQSSLGGQLQVDVGFENQLSLHAVYDLPKDKIDTFFINGRLQNLAMAKFSPALDRYAPFLKPYYSDDTKLTGNLSFQSTAGTGTILGFDGTFATDLALFDLSIGNRSLDAGFTFLADIDGDSVIVNALTLATAGLRLQFIGETEMRNLLPSGELRLYSIADGSLLGYAKFSSLPPSQYRYMVSSPLESSLLLEGIIARDGLETITSKSELSILGTNYPIDFEFTSSTLQIDLKSSDALSVQAVLTPPFRATIQANSFTFPRKGLLANSMLDGEYSFSFNDLHDWQIEADSMGLSSFMFNERSYSMTGSLLASPYAVTVTDFSIQEGNQTFMMDVNYKGSDLLDVFQNDMLLPFTFVFSLHENEENTIEISLVGEKERLAFTLAIQNLDLGRFSSILEGYALDVSSLGHTDVRQNLSMDGMFELTGPEFSFSSDLEAVGSLLKLENSRVSLGDMSLIGQLLTIDGTNGLLSSQGTFDHVRHLSYVDQPSHVAYDLSLEFTPIDTLFNLGSLIREYQKEELVANLTLNDILIYGEGGLSDGTYSIGYKEDVLAITSPLLFFRYDFSEKYLSARIDRQFGIGLNAQGNLEPQNLALELTDLYFPLPLINRLFLKPIFSFRKGVVEGDVIVGGTLADPRVYGQVFIDSSEMELFWLPQDIISVKNVTATMDGERAISPIFPFFSTNKTTGVTVQGNGQIGAEFDGLNLLNYSINAETNEGSVFVWIPIQGIDADVKTYAQGTFNLYGVGFETWLDGEILIQDTSLSLGIKGLPSWYVAAGLTSTKFNLTTGRNVSFLYPNSPNPFIKATIKENQKIEFTFDHLTEVFSVDGNFSFRSGEIYYFQKNFFITEGSLALHTDALSGTNMIQPTINLRAKMTDFDSQGNRVDIYLVLRESSLTNINPQFESIPSKDVNEIFEILGQSILPTGAYGQVNLYSVASLAAAATDVAERLGYINTSSTTALTESIRISLGLDMFSLRSNIVQNILFDALPGSNLTSSLSPLARYLNNTSIFMGKYIGNQFFLQALLHLSAMDSSKVNRSFVVPDLSLDLELSLEWANPLATFSLFTQPNELSIYNILDTIGFSVTRRIVLR